MAPSLLLVLLVGLASAGVRPADPVEAKLTSSLRQALAADAEGRLDVWRYRRPVPNRAEGLSVVLSPALGAAGGPEALVEEVVAEGFVVEAVSGGVVQVWVAWDDLRALAAWPSIRSVREPWFASAKGAGDPKVTEGYDEVMAQDWHLAGITGAGVSVAVVDVGFHGADDLAGTELPVDMTFDLSRGEPEASAHGTAVAEIIHDFAPDAALSLISFSTDVEFGVVLASITDAGVDVINGSIGFDNVWHADGTSSLSIYADRAVSAGAIYVAAAGNEDNKYRVGALGLVEDTATVAIAGLEATPCATSGGFASVSFRWSEPFCAASRDLDLVLVNEDGTECGRSENVQDGSNDASCSDRADPTDTTDWPYESVEASGCSDVVYATIIAAPGADVEGLTGYLYGGYGLDVSAQTHTESLTLPGDTLGGVTVGAWYPESSELAYYSSHGPTNDGRLKPDVVAPTGVTTETYGTGRFDGTSASTPHTAGLAALWVDATRRHGQPERFSEWVTGEALDRGDVGADPAWGFGALHADEIPTHGCGCSSAAGAPGEAVVGGGAWRRGSVLAGLLLLGSAARRQRPGDDKRVRSALRPRRWSV